MDTAQPTEEYALQRSIVAQLHDDVAQLLALCEMRLSEAQQDKNVEDARRYLNRSIAATRRIIQGADTARRSASSLIVMLQDIIEEMAGYRLRTSLAVTGAVPLLETEVVETLGRCVRELLFNVARHAGVLDAHINVSSTAREIVIRVADNGRGFSPGALESVKRRCFGLSSMRNSLADLGIVINIDSQPACGCTITIQAPV